MKKLSLLMTLALVASNAFAGPSILERIRNPFRSEADQRAFYDATGKGYTCMQLLTTQLKDKETFSTLAEIVSYFDAFEKCAERHPEHAQAATLMNYHLLMYAAHIKEARKQGLVTEEEMNKSHKENN